MKNLFIIFLVVVALSVSGISFADDQVVQPQETYQGPSAGSIVGDILARPFLISGAVITSAFGLVTMPAIFLTGLGEEWARITMEAPWRFAAGRPLGEWNTYRDGGPITVLRR